MNCKNCGSELRSDATFCTNCGTKIEAEPITEQPEAVPVQPVPVPMSEQPPHGQFVQQPVQTQQPQMQFAQQPQGQFGQQQKKKSNTGLIVGLSIGGAVLIIGAFVIGLVIGMGIGMGLAMEESNLHSPDINIVLTPDPTPPPDETPPPPDETPPPVTVSDNELVAVWERIGGDYIYFFWGSEFIQFIEGDDGTLNVHVVDDDDWGIVKTDGIGNLIVITEFGTEWEFTYSIVGETLTITDSDYDSTTYIKAG